MKVTRTSGSTGAWLKKDELKSGEPLKIVSEAGLVEGQNGPQLVAKVRRKGETDAYNIAINNTSKNALIELYGDDTKDWVDKVVTAETEQTRIGGKRSTILYLIPEGFEMGETDDGFVAIKRKDVQIGSTKKERTVDVDSEEDLRDAPLPEVDF